MLEFAIFFLVGYLGVVFCFLALVTVIFLWIDVFLFLHVVLFLGSRCLGSFSDGVAFSSLSIVLATIDCVC